MGRILSFALTMVAALTVSIAAHAHEIRPSELAWDAGAGTLTLRVNAEAVLTGIDLSAFPDTDDAPEAADYDALRALDAAALEEAILASDAFAGGVIGEGLGPLTLTAVTVEDAPAELARDAVLVFEAAAEGPVSLGLEERFGEVIATEAGPDGFGALLSPGEVTPPLAGAETESLGASFLRALISGFEHIIPKGLDHIVFVLGLFFYAFAFRPMLWQVTAFTLAHTITLALAATGTIPAPAHIVEPLIALSIAWVGIENVFFRRETIGWPRIAVVFGFGLLHGMGFALVFADALEGRSFILNLVGFNIGVELGQLAVIAVAAALILAPPRRDWPPEDRHDAMRQPASYAIAAIGLWWVLERTILG
ncbi:MAG: HupE/UreJ family protein [Hasllibacter sp.]